MKAIAKNPDERYPSAASLGNEIERYLNDEPVSARPPTVAYLTRKLVRRHRVAFLGAAAAVVAVVLGIVGTSIGLVRANREAQRANREAQIAQQSLVETEEISTFLVDLFEVADPERRSDEPADLRELLERGAERLRLELADQPLARARFLNTIGSVYTRMALFEAAGDLVAEALEIRQSELGSDHPDVLASLNQLGVIRRRQGRLDQAEPVFRQLLAARESAPEQDPVALAGALNSLGNLLWSQEEWEEAEAVHRRALTIRERELGSVDSSVAETLNNLGALLQAQHRFTEAAPLLHRAAEVFAATLGEDHPRYAAGLLNLAIVQMPIGHWQEAEVNLRRAIAQRQGRTNDATRFHQRALEIRRQVLPADHADLAETRAALAVLANTST